MKKYISILMVAVTVLVMAGCSGSKNDVTEPADSITVPADNTEKNITIQKRKDYTPRTAHF